MSEIHINCQACGNPSGGFVVCIDCARKLEKAINKIEKANK